MRKSVLALVGLFFLAACDSRAPHVAHGALDDALAALVAGDLSRFKARVVPAQRSGALGIADGTGFPSGTIAKNLTLDDVLARPFFGRIKAAKSDAEFDSQVTKTSALLVALLDYGSDTIASRTWQMVKRGDAWFIDMKATIRLWQIANGPSTFTALRRIK